MDLSKIMTISGKPGLFKVMAKTRNGIVVESLTDGKRFPVFATERSSTLEDIRIFTKEQEMPLKDVLWKMHEAYEGNPGTDPKSDPDTLKSAFEEILPDYDTQRVYVSDMKKVFTWYNILLEKKMITRPEESEEETTPDKPAGNEESKDTKKKNTD